MIARHLQTIVIPHIQFRHIVLALCLVILALHALPMLSVRYQCATPDTCDDGDELRLVQQGGPLAIVPYYWTHWSGRWGYALASGVFKTLPEDLAGLPLIGILALWAWACYGSGKEWGLSTLVLTLLVVPRLDQNLYWQSGAIAYSLPLALVCVMLVGVKRGWSGVITASLAIFVAALGDTVGVAQVVVIGALWLIFPTYRKSLTIVGVAALVGLIFVQLAPGNVYRKAYFPTPDLGLALPYAIRATGAVVAEATRNHVWLLVGVLAIPRLGYRRWTKVAKTRALVIILAVVGLNFVLQLAAYYATSGPLAGRSAIVPIFFTLAGLGIIVTAGKGTATRPRTAPARPSGVLPAP